MTITKLGHCCLLIEEAGLRILTDPGAWTEGVGAVRNIDVLMITHEHPDHLHLSAVKEILVNSPKAKIFTVASVQAILLGEQIASEILGHNQITTFRNVELAGFGEKHALIYPTITPVDNTGYLIAKRFYYPGDALTVPEVPVEILALPVAGPWLLLSDSIEFALKLKPKIAFPVHDGMLNKLATVYNDLPKRVLKSSGIDFQVLELGVAQNIG